MSNITSKIVLSTLLGGLIFLGCNSSDTSDTNGTTSSGNTSTSGQTTSGYNDPYINQTKIILNEENLEGVKLKFLGGNTLEFLDENRFSAQFDDKDYSGNWSYGDSTVTLDFAQAYEESSRWFIKYTDQLSDKSYMNLISDEGVLIPNFITDLYLKASSVGNDSDTGGIVSDDSNVYVNEKPETASYYIMAIGTNYTSESCDIVRDVYKNNEKGSVYFYPNTTKSCTQYNAVVCSEVYNGSGTGSCITFIDK